MGYKDYIILSDTIYEVIENKEKEYWEDIFKSSRNEDGTISYEIRYYNGGCSFDEAIKNALNGLKS